MRAVIALLAEAGPRIAANVSLQAEDDGKESARATTENRLPDFGSPRSMGVPGLAQRRKGAHAFAKRRASSSLQKGMGLPERWWNSR